MYTVEALDRLILFRQKPDSLLRRLMATEEAVRVAAQGELVALAVETAGRATCGAAASPGSWCQVKILFPSYGSGVPADRTR